MEICGEHGAEIAYTKDRYNSDCPACEQIAEIEKEHETIIEQKDEEIQDLQSEIDTLEIDLQEANEDLGELR